MAADEKSANEAEASRKFLEEVLAEDGRHGFPGGKELGELIKKVLAQLPPPSHGDDDEN